MEAYPNLVLGPFLGIQNCLRHGSVWCKIHKTDVVADKQQISMQTPWAPCEAAAGWQGFVQALPKFMWETILLWNRTFETVAEASLILVVYVVTFYSSF